VAPYANPLDAPHAEKANGEEREYQKHLDHRIIS
jgi:hypothetical protein